MIKRRRFVLKSCDAFTVSSAQCIFAEIFNYVEPVNQTKVAIEFCVGHSTGGGEVTRYIGRHGTKRVAKAVLISAIPPLMLKTPNNPGGLPIEVFDQLRAGVRADRAQFFQDLSVPFYGANRPGAKVSDDLRRSFWLQGMGVRNQGRI